MKLGKRQILFDYRIVSQSNNDIMRLILQTKTHQLKKKLPMQRN